MDTREAFDLDLYGQRVAVLEPDEETTKGGLYIPDEAKEGSMKLNEGVVVGIGEDVDFVKIDDYIYYTTYSGHTATRNGVEFRVMNEEDIIGRVLTKEETE